MSRSPRQWSETDRLWQSTLEHAENRLTELYERRRLLERARRAIDAEIGRVEAIRDAIEADLRSDQSTSHGLIADLTPAEVVELRQVVRTARPDNWSRDLWSVSGPTTKQAIVECLRISGRPMGPQDVLKTLTENGWMPRSQNPLGLVTNALHQLHADPEAPVDRIAKGRYWLRH